MLKYYENNGINWKNHGYSKGGQLNKLVKASGEDGLFFGRSGEEVLSEKKLDLANNVTMNLIDFAKKMPNINGIRTNSQNNNIENNVTLDITLQGVQDPEQFAKMLQSNKNIQKIVQSITVDNLTGSPLKKNSLNKFKY